MEGVSSTVSFSIKLHISLVILVELLDSVSESVQDVCISIDIGMIPYLGIVIVLAISIGIHQI